jgi:hypothetical protein
VKRLMIVALVVAGGLLLAVATSPFWIDAALKMNGCRSGVCSWLSTEVELKRHVAKDNSP